MECPKGRAVQHTLCFFCNCMYFHSHKIESREQRLSQSAARRKEGASHKHYDCGGLNSGGKDNCCRHVTAVAATAAVTATAGDDSGENGQCCEYCGGDINSGYGNDCDFSGCDDGSGHGNCWDDSGGFDCGGPISGGYGNGKDDSGGYDCGGRLLQPPRRRQLPRPHWAPVSSVLSRLHSDSGGDDNCRHWHVQGSFFDR